MRAEVQATENNSQKSDANDAVDVEQIDLAIDFANSEKEVVIQNESSDNINFESEEGTQAKPKNQIPRPADIPMEQSPKNKEDKNAPKSARETSKKMLDQEKDP